MIRANNPEIDVYDLMKRVRAEADRIRVNGSIDERFWRDDDDRRMARAVDRHHFIASLVNEAEENNKPRSNWPRRLALFARTGPIARFFMRVWNYFFKQQREKDAAIVRALREMLTIQTQMGDYVLALRESIRGNDAGRKLILDEFDALRPDLAHLKSMLDRLAGLEDAHHHTREAALGANSRADALEEKFIGALREPLEKVDVLFEAGAQLAAKLGHLNARIDSAEAVLQSFNARLAGTPTVSDVQIRIADNAQSQRHYLEQGLALARRSDALIRAELSDIRRMSLPTDPADHAARKPHPYPGERSREALYLAIEDEFRGSREVVSERLSVYIPVLRECGTVTPETPLLDLGAGRGEFVNLLNAEHLAARGVDGNAIAVAEAQSLGIPIEHGDLFAALRGAPNESLGAISAIHVIEHLSFDLLVELFEQSLRALVPGGVLLLETPNPNNLIVSAKSFHLDPTHIAPIPNELARFIAESVGYTAVEVRELHASDERRLDDASPLAGRFNELMYGPQDYAIVAYAPSE